MLQEKQLFGNVDLVETAIARIREFEPMALQLNPAGYWVAFSGGKDSQVVLDLVRLAGVKHEAHFSITTVDPPELMQFIKKEYPDVIRTRPKISMWQLIVKKMMPPTRLVRYCCEHLKESGGDGYMVITGVRWAESLKRSKRRMIESCNRSQQGRKILNPIIEWSDAEVWEYIRSRNMPYCRLYGEGFKRIGCVGCPMAGRSRIKEFNRWPGFKKSYLRAFEKIAVTGTEANKQLNWKNGKDVFSWWMKDKHETIDPDQGVLFE